MNYEAILTLAQQVGFNGALVVCFMWCGNRFLTKLLNHISHMQAEMEEHTKILNQLLAITKSSSKG